MESSNQVHSDRWRSHQYTRVLLRLDFNYTIDLLIYRGDPHVNSRILRLQAKLNTSTSKWEHKATFDYFDLLFISAEMKTKRDRAGAAAFGGKIYVFGGSYGHVAVTSVECYDWREDEWSTITELPYPRYGFRCATTSVSRDLMAEVPPAKPKMPSQENLI